MTNAAKKTGGEAAKTTGGDKRLWFATQCLDYVWFACVAFTISRLFGGPGRQHSTLGLTRACTALGVISPAVLEARERVNFWLLADRLPRCKRTRLSRATHWYVLQTAAASMSSFFLLYKYDLIYYEPVVATPAFWLSIFAPFNALLALRDVVFLAPLHRLLHQPRWYRGRAESKHSLRRAHVGIISTASTTRSARTRRACTRSTSSSSTWRSRTSARRSSCSAGNARWGSPSASTGSSVYS